MGVLVFLVIVGFGGFFEVELLAGLVLLRHGQQFKCSVSISWPEACSAPASPYTAAAGRELLAPQQERCRAGSQE